MRVEVPDFMAKKLSRGHPNSILFLTRITYWDFESNTERPLIPLVVSVIFTVLLNRVLSCCSVGQPMHLDNPL